jgi:hypothetical protein
VSPVPRRHQYYEGATTSRSRISRSLIGFASGALAVPPWFVLAGASAPGWMEVPPRARIVGQPVIHLPAHFRVDASGTSQVPRRSLLCLCSGLRPRPNRRALASGGLTSAAPAAARAKASACYRYRGYRGASAPAVYASRAVLPPPMQDSLPTGWLAFAGRELNPLDRDDRFPSCYILFPLSWIYPDATLLRPRLGQARGRHADRELLACRRVALRGPPGPRRLAGKVTGLWRGHLFRSGRTWDDSSCNGRPDTSRC